MEPTKPDHRPQGGPPNRPIQPQRLIEQIPAAEKARTVKLIEDTPHFEESLMRGINTLDQAKKASDEQIRRLEQQEVALAQKKVVLEEMAEDIQRTKEVLENTQQEYKFKEEELDLLVKQNRQTNDALKRELAIANPPKPWNWKRVGLAVVSGLAGVATAFVLRKKAPILNMAAGACGVANMAKKTGVFGKHSVIFGAGGGLATRWAHDNDNAVGLTTECILAGGAWGELYFTALDKGAEMSGEAVKAFKEGYEKATNKVIDPKSAA